MFDVIVSMEWQIGKLDLHVIMLNQTNGYTYKVESIYNKKTLEKILDAIMCNDFKTLQKFIVERYGLSHVTVRFTYGYTLRNYIKNYRKEHKKHEN